ncbi:leader peptidase (prepilin peptidase)/N-methyltransferase [Saccharothrix ecbatanensis]|uniref:Leader peptidase (Prepilin peptidase)/N-methyltransferase n=1 Tax=Saccharothrix ecbatanensis TaxID=1105145 RepID=A0A7W9HFG0_9PSEU|nr:prepilin peptidase [Saccharothrix ecbatanensis]MBB5801288.1 leader peptidase (prepilin peptidase)/N-methyltransferase [Saccharothrix ecbatanensis]
MSAEWSWTLVGIACGPTLTALTARAAAGQPLFPPPWWRPNLSREAFMTTSVLCALLALMSYRFAGSPLLPAVCWLAITGTQLVLIDLTCHRLPHAITGAMFLGGLVLLGYAALRVGGTSAFLRAVTASGLLFATMLAVAVLASPMIGGGDVALLGTVGLYLGWVDWSRVVVGLLLALLMATLAATALLASRRIGPRDPFAIGPAIVGGTLIALGLP